MMASIFFMCFGSCFHFGVTGGLGALDV